MDEKAGQSFEGGGATKFVHLMRKHGYNKDINIELATVTNAPPELKIKIDNMPEELLAEDLIVAEWLTKHTRKMKVTIPKLTITGFQTSNLGMDWSMSPAGEGPHTHGMSFNGLSMGGTGKATSPDNTEAVFAEIEFTDELKVGDRVIVAEVSEGQSYIILDRAVIY